MIYTAASTPNAYDHRIVNDNVDEAYSELRTIVEKV